MSKMKIRLKKTVNESYQIFIGTGQFNSLAKILKREKFGQKYALICSL